MTREAASSTATTATTMIALRLKLRLERSCSSICCCRRACFAARAFFSLAELMLSSSFFSVLWSRGPEICVAEYFSKYFKKLQDPNADFPSGFSPLQRMCSSLAMRSPLGISFISSRVTLRVSTTMTR